MTEKLPNIFLAILAGWVAFAFFSFVAGPVVSLVAAIAIGTLSPLAIGDTIAWRGAIAVLAPIGAVLPMLALRDVAGDFGLVSTRFTSTELVLFLGAYMAFLAASMGVVQVDLFRYGYAPVPVGAIVLALCFYGLLTGNPFIPLVAVSGQLLWVLGLGSSNWFDHVLHVLLVPIVLVELVLRIF